MEAIFPFPLNKIKTMNKNYKPLQDVSKTHFPPFFVKI